jgi:hypothetical protein
MFNKFKISLKYTVYVLLIGLVISQHYYISSLSDNLERANNSLDSTLTELARIKYKKFDYVSNKFKVFNPDIENSTIRQFMAVMKHYNLDTTNKIYETCISQICLESTARQRDENGNVIISSGGAVGITQITPTTAHHYLVNVLSDEDKKELIKLGGTDYTFLGDSKQLGNNRKKLIKWLSNINNNIILWGYIMRHTLKTQNYNLHNALVVYKDGPAGLSRFVEKGNDTSKHSYVLKIIQISTSLIKKS